MRVSELISEAAIDLSEYEGDTDEELTQKIAMLRQTEQMAAKRAGHYEDRLRDINAIVQPMVHELKLYSNDRDRFKRYRAAKYWVEIPKDTQFAPYHEEAKKAADDHKKSHDIMLHAKRSVDAIKDLIHLRKTSVTQIPVERIPEKLPTGAGTMIQNPYFKQPMITRYAGAPEGFNWKIQQPNYDKLKEALARNGKKIGAVFACTFVGHKGHYGGEFKTFTTFAASTTDGSVVWYKYEGGTVASGTNNIYVHGKKMKLSHFLMFTSRTQDMKLRGE